MSFLGRFTTFSKTPWGVWSKELASQAPKFGFWFVAPLPLIGMWLVAPALETSFKYVA
jgi:hypothetical protein